MTAYWLAQGVGVIAFLIGITTFFNRDERRFRLQLAVYSATIGVHFFFDGRLACGNERRAQHHPHARLNAYPQTVGNGRFYSSHPGSRAGKVTACNGAVADNRHAGQHLGAVSLPGVNRALRDVVRNRLLGYS